MRKVAAIPVKAFAPTIHGFLLTHSGAILKTLSKNVHKLQHTNQYISVGVTRYRTNQFGTCGLHTQLTIVIYY